MEQTYEQPPEGEYQLTVAVRTEEAVFFSDGVEAVEQAAMEGPSTDEGLFAFPPDFTLAEPLPPEGLTPFEQQTLLVMLTDNYDPFDPFYVGQDGEINMELVGDVWWSARVLFNQLTDAGVAPENYEAVATEWLMG